VAVSSSSLVAVSRPITPRISYESRTCDRCSQRGAARVNPDNRPMERFNVFGADYTYSEDRPAGYRCGSVRFGPLVGASRIAGTIYELPSGESTWPYHYEYGSEEWLLVLDGRPISCASRTVPAARTSSRPAVTSPPG